jgi:hypothetical protein
MLNNDSHLSDQELLLVADGELSPRRDAQARAHLAACWTCRTRMGEIESTIADFTRLQRETSDRHLPSAAGSRALLRARLAELAAVSRPRLWPLLLRSALASRIVAGASAVLLIAALGIWGIQRHRLQSEFDSTFADREHSPIPNRTFTPGAIRPVTKSDVCPARGNEVPREVPISVRQRIFQEYGMANAQPAEYELDYLITPELGGSDDPRNLWPEPRSVTAWNSYVKDALEDRLHQLVCNGSLGLDTAQHDIATNWISAYKKYFHTDKPSSIRSDLILSAHRPNS